ncbi:VWA domain-containing protein [Nocardia sp. NPDC052001]|uniref:vWA domain-containing protein n=1 Tax=Nocardia sp. NPDC052001 TaxID=3154853 RepID=UPI0034403DE3
MSTTTRLTALFAAATVALLPSLLPATAPARPDSPQYAPTMLILDASGSMQRPDADGTMMDSAKRAVRGFVGSAPTESKVGLAVYGAGTGNAEADKAAGCSDVQVLQRPETLDRGALTGAVDGIQARGWTPMGVSLRKAAAALPISGPRSIVLVSDGDDTCAPPEPCDVARELKQQGLGLIVHSIGFAVDEKARAQLSCMAQATGGTYADAADGKALERILPRMTGAALRNYAASGTPITGTGDYRTAPDATQGHYLDTVGQHEKRYYGVDVPADGTAYFSGVVSFPRLPDISVADDFNTMNIRVFDRDGKDCNVFEYDQASHSSDGVTLAVSLTFRGAVEGAPGGTCHGAGRYYFQLDWDKVSNGLPQRLPLELMIGVEPGVTDRGPAASEVTTTFADPGGAELPVTGGGSLASAATLGGAGRYTDTLRPGEYVFYRVKADWGQGLSYRVNFAANGGTGTKATSNIETVLYSPVAAEVASDTHVYTGTDVSLPISDKPIATVPIRYANRDSSTAAVTRQAVAGWYYISVKLGSPVEAGDERPVPIRLDLSLAGAPEPGPKYASGATGSVTGGGSKGMVVTQAAAPGEVSSTDDDRRGSVLIAVSAGAVVVIAAIAAFVLVRRRRG